MVGVCIKYMHENYGGILQAYATVNYLEKHNIKYELIKYTRKKTMTEVIKDVPRLFNAVWINSRYEGVQRQLSLKRHREYAENNKIRMEAFARFKERAFRNISDDYVGYEALCEASKKYSVVVTGSDQLWSPAGLPTNFFNLMFVPKEILKISVASSFGVSNIPWYQKKRTKKFLERIEYVSMRENRGSEIVEELTGRKVPTILDPVFFLSREEWLELIPNERVMEGPYVLAYFLGNNKEYRKVVSDFARVKDLKIVALRHMDQYIKEDENFGDIAPYNVDPCTFLNLLRNAEYVFTDSFHGTAFSIINRKQFVVFNRYSDTSSVSKNSRIDTLCQNFGLSVRRYSKENDLISMVSENIDYLKVAEMFEKQKKNTDRYMQKIVDEIREKES